VAGEVKQLHMLHDCAACGKILGVCSAYCYDPCADLLGRFAFDRFKQHGFDVVAENMVITYHWHERRSGDEEGTLLR
jgi:hypothetical protein